jgi:hypothetical protein
MHHDTLGDGTTTGIPVRGDIIVAQYSAGEILWARLPKGDAGALLKSGATDTDWFPKGSANQIIRVNVAGTDIEYFDRKHTLLDGGGDDGWHTDTDSGSPVQGDIIVAQDVGGTDKWKRFAKGAAKRPLRMNDAGTDPEWYDGPDDEIKSLSVQDSVTGNAHSLQSKTRDVTVTEGLITNITATPGSWYTWGTLYTVPTGGSQYQVLQKLSATNYDYGWDWVRAH